MAATSNLVSGAVFMKIKSVPITWMKENSCRLDCNPFMSGSIEARMTLESLNCTKSALSTLTRGGIKGIVNAGRIKRVWVENPEEGIPFLSSSDILETDLSNFKYVTKNIFKKHPDVILEPNTILITRTGTIGKIMYVRDGMVGMGCSEHVMRVFADEEKILSGYLYAYLGSKYGVPLVVAGTYGSIIQSIEPHHLEDLPVPRIDAEKEKDIDTLVKQAYSWISKYQEKIEQATKMVFTYSGVSQLSVWDWRKQQNKELGFTIKSNKLSTLRAWNQSSRLQDVKDDIANHSYSLLGEITDFDWLKWRVMFKRIDADPEHGIEAITQKQLFRLFPEGRWVSRSYMLDLSPKYQVPDGTILIAKQGTLGESELYCRAEFITGEDATDRAYTDHCMRVVADGIDSGYLYAFLRSHNAFRLLRGMSEGSKQQDLHFKVVPSMPVPRCSLSQEEEIGILVREAYKLRNDGVKQLDMAHRKIESYIDELKI
jgi:type I restriction enzyme S subunit